MMNQLNLTLLLFFTLNLSAQDRNVILLGKVTSDSLAIENVHIINKTSKKGVISNTNGEFEIVVQLKDTLLFSDIQFYLVEIIITEQIIDEKHIDVPLLQRINTLNEIVIKAHDLSGNLAIDSKHFKDSLQKANTLALNYKGNYKASSNIVAKKLDPNYLPDVTDPMAPIGGDLIGLTLFLFKPLIKEVSKIGKNKRDLKKKERDYQKQVVKAPEKIRTEFGDAFFTQNLNISTKQIDAFILHCDSKGIIDLFLRDKKMEMIDIFLKESKTFKTN